ncbi:MAG TPA: cupin-like domain-containing protein [Nannocystaceae bacterium]|nr:cupin-like domain-containing protein [Nannocystaceae bacterium]
MTPIDERIDSRAGLDLNEFHAQYLEPEVPVVLADVVARWPAATKWSPQALIERFGDYPIRANYHPDAVMTAWKRMRADTTLGAVLGDHDPRTFVSANLFAECPYLVDDIDIPPIIRPDWIEDQARLWIQPRGNRTGLHWDSFSSLICVVRGRKRLLLFAPDQLELLYPCAVTGSKDFSMGSWSRLDVFAPDFAEYPAARAARYHDVTIEEGETILVPRHWWHAVENLGTPTISVSFFVTPQGKSELTFYHDRRLIAGLSIKVGVLSGAHRRRAT